MNHSKIITTTILIKFQLNVLINSEKHSCKGRKNYYHLSLHDSSVSSLSSLQSFTLSHNDSLPTQAPY